VKQGGGCSRDEARLEQTPYPFYTQLNLRYLGIKYGNTRFNQGVSHYCRGLKSEQGAQPLALPHFNHWMSDVSATVTDTKRREDGH